MLIIFSNIADQMYRNDEISIFLKIHSHVYGEALQFLKMSKRLVNLEDLYKFIAQTSGAISMINDSNYRIRSTFAFFEFLCKSFS
jgi:hypothetical protein